MITSHTLLFVVDELLFWVWGRVGPREGNIKEDPNQQGKRDPFIEAWRVMGLERVRLIGRYLFVRVQVQTKAALSCKMGWLGFSVGTNLVAPYFDLCELEFLLWVVEEKH